MANDEESIQKPICFFSSAREAHLFMRIGRDRRLEAVRGWASAINVVVTLNLSEICARFGVTSIDWFQSRPASPRLAISNIATSRRSPTCRSSRLGLSKSPFARDSDYEGLERTRGPFPAHSTGSACARFLVFTVHTIRIGKVAKGSNLRVPTAARG